VALNVDGQWREVRVEDTGPRIAEEMREKVFELGHTTRPAEGKGFGLAYLRNYLTLLGGSISAGEGADGGAVLTVRLPMLPGGAGNR